MRHRLSWLFYSWCPCVYVSLYLDEQQHVFVYLWFSLIRIKVERVCVYVSKQEAIAWMQLYSPYRWDKVLSNAQHCFSVSLIVHFFRSKSNTHTHTTLPHTEYKQAVASSGIVYYAVASNNLHIHSLTQPHTGVCGRASDKWTLIHTHRATHTYKLRLKQPLKQMTHSEFEQPACVRNFSVEEVLSLLWCVCSCQNIV